MVNKIKHTLKWTQEALAIILFIPNLALGVINIIFSLDKTKNRKSKYPRIVIFEQWFVKNYWHLLLKRYLERRGFVVYWTNYSLYKGGIEEGARYLDGYIKENKLDNIILIGISYGAVSSFAYLQKMKGWSKVDKFISVAGPFKGTPLALDTTLIKGIRQINPESDYIQTLSKTKISAKNNIVSITAENDEIVPRKFSFLRNSKNILIKVTGHNFLHMFSKDLFRTIYKEASKTSRV